MKTNKKLRRRMEESGVVVGKWTPEAASSICCTCGKQFDPDGPPPYCIAQPGTRDARRYYPLGLYTHQTHSAGTQEWFLSLDPRDARDQEMVRAYEGTYGPHPGKPKYGMSSLLIIERLSLPLTEAPVSIPKAIVRRVVEEEVSEAPPPVRTQGTKTSVSRSSLPVAPGGGPTPHQKKEKVVHPISAALNGLDEKKLTAIAKANSLSTEWAAWVKKFTGNFPMAKMQLNGALRRLHDKGIKVKGI